MERRYAGLAALSGISFAIEPGEIFDFFDPNGTGKTIRIRTGQLHPSTGRVRVMCCGVVTEREALKPQIRVVSRSTKRPSMSLPVVGVPERPK